MTGRFLRIAFAAAMAALLSGCWVSEEPLITSDVAAAPDIVGTYRNEDDDNVAVSDLGGGQYLFDDGSEPVTLAFLALGGDWYLAQFPLDTDEGEGEEFVYLYQPMRIVDRNLEFHMPDCTADMADIEDVTIDDESCMVTSVPALHALSARFMAKFDAGEVDNEPGVLTRID